MGNSFKNRPLGDLECNRPAILTKGFGIGTHMLPAGTHLLIKEMTAVDFALRQQMLSEMAIFPDLAVHLLRYNKLAVMVVSVPESLDDRSEGKKIIPKPLDGQYLDPAISRIQDIPKDSAIILAVNYDLQVDGGKVELIEDQDAAASTSVLVKDAVNSVLAGPEIDSFLRGTDFVRDNSPSKSETLSKGTPLILRRMGKNSLLQKLLGDSSGLDAVPPDTELKFYLSQ